MGQLGRVRVTNAVFEVQTETGTRYQLAVRCDLPHPQLGALQISQNANRAVQIGLHLADAVIHLAHAVMAPVAHVQAKGISTRLKQSADHLF